MPKISLVMPTLNCEEKIVKTIESIISQSEKDWELIVVDGGSNDETVERIEKIADKRIKIVDGEGLHISESRNLGNALSLSEIIAVCDSDDLYAADRLKITLDYFSKDKDLGFFYGYFDVFEEDRNLVRPAGVPYIPFDLEKLKTTVYISHPTVAYRKEVAMRFPYNSFYQLAEDYDLTTRIAVSRVKIQSTGEKLVRKVIHGKSAGEKQREIQHLYADYVRVCRGWEPVEPFDLKTFFETVLSKR